MFLSFSNKPSHLDIGTRPLRCYRSKAAHPCGERFFQYLYGGGAGVTEALLPCPVVAGGLRLIMWKRSDTLQRAYSLVDCAAGACAAGVQNTRKITQNKTPAVRATTAAARPASLMSIITFSHFRVTHTRGVA